MPLLGRLSPAKHAIVQAKTRLPGLIWHVTIHLITMLVVILGLLETDSQVALAAILALTGFHFSISGKPFFRGLGRAG